MLDMKFFWILPALLMGCASPPAKQGFATIKPDMFAGYSYHLVSDQRIEDYIFGSDGVVAATIGTREMVAGVTEEVVAGPLLYWRIRDEKKLIISDEPEGDMRTSLVFKSISENRAVTVGGRVFTRQRVQPLAGANRRPAAGRR